MHRVRIECDGSCESSDSYMLNDARAADALVSMSVAPLRPHGCGRMRDHAWRVREVAQRGLLRVFVLVCKLCRCKRTRYVMMESPYSAAKMA
jgi:hypothetical protein